MSAILNYVYAELDLDKRNPFTRLIIRNEGDDVSKRGTSTNEQLKNGYDKAVNSRGQVKLRMPLLGENGSITNYIKAGRTYNFSTRSNSDGPTTTKGAILQGLDARLKGRRVAETVLESCLAQYGWKK